jgi:hypothetical protein
LPAEIEKNHNYTRSEEAAVKQLKNFGYRQGWEKLKFFAALLTAMAASLFIAGCGVFQEEGVPKELMGHWETDAPGYQGCFMDITEATISFHTVKGTTDVNFIQKVERTQKNGAFVYDINYENMDGDEFLLSVTVLGGGEKGVLQFYNQKYLTWNKVDWTKY